MVEHRRDRPRYAAALEGGSLLVCRLRVDPALARIRLAHRHADDVDARDWHLHRAAELAAVLDRAGVDDVEVDTDRRSPDEVAQEVERHAGWAP